MNKTFDIDKSKVILFVLCLLAIILLIWFDIAYTEKAVNDCISSGISEDICESE
jgi:hypothetical protein